MKRRYNNNNIFITSSVDYTLPYHVFCVSLYLFKQNQLDVLLLNNIFKIRKYMTEIAKKNMNFGGRLSHEFAIFGKNFCIDLLNALH